MPGSATSALRIYLLGGLAITVGGRAIADDAWASRKARQLVALLALAPGQQLARDQLLDLLWPELAPDAAADGLYHALLGARRALDPDRVGLLPLKHQIVALRPPSPPWIDVVAFEAAAVAARRGGDPAAYEAALALYGGDLLPEERYADWAAGRREVLRETWLALLGELASLHERRREWPRAIVALERAIAAEPAREEAQAALMRLLAYDGQRAAALRQYARLRAVLRDELDADPDPTTQHLYHAILADQFPPPAAAAPSPRPPLPLPLTNLVGREAAVCALTEALERARLITLTGPGGVGKTRIALAVARAVAAAYSGGVALVELAALADGTLVPSAVAAALGVQEEPGRPLAATLVAALGGRRLLLLLDNCEHLADACARLAADLLASCPGLQILATSRAALHLPGELRWRVPPLPVPPVDTAPLPAAPADLVAIPSVQLFLDRAEFARPDFILTPENAAAVATICARLDGLPLALELAAARVAHLPIDQLAARLGDAPRLLASATRAVPHRQRTLRATLDWSVDLLAPAERALLARLAVFAGGWTLAAAETVCADDGLPGDAILPLLGTLVDQSLVQVETGAGDEVRYRLLEPVRQYAAEHLAREPSGRSPEMALRARHAGYFLALAEAAGPALLGPTQPTWIARLEAEYDNLRGALRWAIEHGEAMLAVRLASALSEFWTTREHGREGRRWLEEALTAAGEAVPIARGPALASLGHLAWRMGEYPAARAAAEEAVALAGEARDPAVGAAARRVLGLIAASQTDVATAVAHYEAAMALLGPSPAPAHAVDLLNDLALCAREQGDVARAVSLLEEALHLLRPAGSPGQTARTLINLAFLAFAAREYPRAGAFLREALPLCHRTGAWRMAGHCLLNLGWIAYQAGGYAEAATAYTDALRLVHHSGSPRDVVAAVYGLALVAWGQGALSRAALLHGAVAAQREAFDCPLTDADRALLADRLDLTPLHAGLGEDAFAAAWAAGFALSLEGVIAAALAEMPSDHH